MPITATKPKSDPTPAGNHIARVYSIVHIGTNESEWNGQLRDRNQVRIGFELPMKKKAFKEGEPERPFVISEMFTLSTGKNAALRPIIEGIIGRPLRDDEADFDVTTLMGMTCMLNVVHETKNGNVYGNIASAAPLPDGIEAPPAVNEPFLLDYDDNWSEEKFNSLPDFIKDKMKTSQEYRAKYGIEAPVRQDEEINPEDIPF